MIRRVVNALLAALIAPPCAVCARVLDEPLDGAVCQACWDRVVVTTRGRRPSNLIAVTAAIGEYDGVLRDIVHALKYDGRRSTAPPLARLMVRHGGDVLDGADAVVPVPLHARRQRERGFNQAEDLARGLMVPVVPALRRVRATDPQVGLSASARKRNVHGAFEVTSPRSVAHSRIVIVDDVTTTGATLEACARVLKRAGAREVRALTAARVSSALR